MSDFELQTRQDALKEAQDYYIAAQNLNRVAEEKLNRAYFLCFVAAALFTLSGVVFVFSHQ